MLPTMMTSSLSALLVLLLVSASSGGLTPEVIEGSGGDPCDSCQSNEICALNERDGSRQCSRYAPELVCGRNHLEVGVMTSHMKYPGLDAASAHLADRLCTAHQTRNGTVWYQAERKEGSCGNVLTTNGTHATYSNTLFIYFMGQKGGKAVVDLPFSCVYPMDTHTSMDVAVKPYLDMDGDGIVGHGSRAKASMSLFRNANFTGPYPAGKVDLPLGSVLNVGVSVEETEMERFAVVLENCYATHSANPDDLMRYYLIKSKCPTDRRQVSVIESGSSLKAHFSALLFLFQGDYRPVFLHCSLTLCDKKSAACKPMCSRRAARSISDSRPLKPLTIGPINLA